MWRDIFATRHIFEEGGRRAIGVPVLAVNAGISGSAAVLFQYTAGVLMVLKDWMEGAAPGVWMRGVYEEASMAAGRAPQPVAPPDHFDNRNSFGLLASLRGVAGIRKGGDPLGGRGFIRELLRTSIRGESRFLLGPEATWTRRAMFGGFCTGTGSVEPKEGLYRTLMLGLESAIAPAAFKSAAEQPVAVTPDGRRYSTAEVKYR